MASEGFESWALVELMGHQRICGRVTEAEIGGCKFIRVDVPESDEQQSLTKYLGPSSIYAITPLTEETARETARRIDSAPINIWDARILTGDDDKRKARELPSSISNSGDQEEDNEPYPYSF